MLPYIVKRVLGMIPSLIIISFITFFVIQLPPGDFVTSVQSQVASSGGGMDAATVEALRVRYGLDQPQVVQYWRWIKGFPTGDFGYSLEWSAPVWDVIATRMGWTLLLSGLALVFMWVVSIPIGVYSATHQYSIGDNIFSFLGFLGLSIPDFLLSLIWLVVGTLVLGIPAYGLFSPEMADAPWSLAKFLDLLKHLWAPVIIMGIIGTAELIRIMRGSLLDILNQQYVTTAGPRGCMRRRSLRNTVRMAINPSSVCWDADTQDDLQFHHCWTSALHPNCGTDLFAVFDLPGYVLGRSHSPVYGRDVACQQSSGGSGLSLDRPADPLRVERDERSARFQRDSSTNHRLIQSARPLR